MKTIFAQCAIPFCLVLTLLLGACGEKKEEHADSEGSDNDGTDTATTLSAPANLSVTAGVNKVTLDWDAVSGASSYTVYWGTSTGISSSSTAITSISTDNYTHSSLTNDTTYYYKVAAVDSSGTGTLSSETSAAPSATWAQEAYVKAANNDPSDEFGSSVALSGDTLAVGVNLEDSDETTITNGTTASDDDSNVSSGAVYVYKRTGTSWAQEAYVKAANNGANDNFGYSVALSGDTLAVGSHLEDSNETTITNSTSTSSDDSSSNSGAVYVYKRTGTSWAQEAYVKAANNDSGDRFGWYVALDGDTLAVGSPFEFSNQTTITNGTTASSDDSIEWSGAVYVYKRTGTSWAQEAYVKAANNDWYDKFGYSVALDGDTLAVGASEEDSNQTTITNGTTASSNKDNPSSGAVYVYKRTGTSWAQEAYVKAANNDHSDQFGSSVALSGDTLAVGVNLEDSNETTITNGTTASSDDNSTNSGAVYVYKRTGTSWAQEAYVKAANNGADDYFGYSVALDGDTLAVGAYKEDSNQTTITNGTTASSDDSITNSGAVYVYKRTGTSWAQEAYVKAANNDASDEFGKSVALSGGTLAVGSHLEDSNETTITNGTIASSDDSSTNSGAVYVYLVQ